MIKNELTQRWHPNRGVGTCEKCNVFKATKLARNTLIKPAGGETHIAD